MKLARRSFLSAALAAIASVPVLRAEQIGDMFVQPQEKPWIAYYFEDFKDKGVFCYVQAGPPPSLLLTREPLS